MPENEIALADTQRPGASQKPAQPDNRALSPTEGAWP